MFFNILTYIVLALYIYTIGAAIAALLLENRHPSKSIAWVMAIVLIPIAGPIIYFIFGRDSWRRIKLRRRTERVSADATNAGNSDTEPYLNIKTLLFNNSGIRATDGNSVTLITNSQDIFSGMLNSIATAKDYILAEFYIIENDNIGNRFCDALRQKAREGVTVMLLIDALGSISMPKKMIRALENDGVQLRHFMPMKFNWWGRLRRSTINYRDHRKLLVIDGTTSYIGGVNIADRYLTGNELGIWRDNMLRICGPAINAMQSSFVNMWRLAGKQNDSSNLPPLRTETATHGDTCVQITPSAPFNDWEAIAQGLQWTILNAQRYVYMQSPYFAPPEKILSAIHAAALSGVDVRIMMPAESDTPVTAAASRTYIERMLLAGVRVFIYRKTFLHSKSVVADDKIVTIGSANLDERSANLNFELNAFVYDSAIAEQARQNFESQMAECEELDLKHWGQRPWWQRLKESMARLFSPMI